MQRTNCSAGTWHQPMRAFWKAAFAVARRPCPNIRSVQCTCNRLTLWRAWRRCSGHTFKSSGTAVSGLGEATLTVTERFAFQINAKLSTWSFGTLREGIGGRNWWSLGGQLDVPECDATWRSNLVLRLGETAFTITSTVRRGQGTPTQQDVLPLRIQSPFSPPPLIVVTHFRSHCPRRRPDSKQIPIRKHTLHI